MKLIIYDDVKKFIEDCEDILKTDVRQNCFFFHHIQDALKSGDEFNMLMMSVKNESGDILITSVKRLSVPMLIYETANKRDDNAVAFFVDALLKNKIKVDYIMAESGLAKSFCEFYAAFTGNHFTHTKNVTQYVLDEIADCKKTNGFLRKIEQNDIFYLPYWYADLTPSCSEGSYDLPTGIIKTEHALQKGSTYVWEDGCPVSLAACLWQANGCAYIENVYTPPHFRGKGYGTACVHTLTESLLQEGHKLCGLFADDSNPSSGKMYKKIGYKEIFTYSNYKLTPFCGGRVIDI